MKNFCKILFAAAAIVAAFAAVRVCILLDKLEFIKGAVEKNIQADMRAVEEYLKGVDTVFDAYEKTCAPLWSPNPNGAHCTDTRRSTGRARKNFSANISAKI